MFTETLSTPLWYQTDYIYIERVTSALLWIQKYYLKEGGCGSA